MARLKCFSDQEIIDAAEAMQAAGKNITGFTLRTQLGKGRPDSLQATYDELVYSGRLTAVESHSVVVPDEALTNTPLPAEVSDQLSVLMSDIQRMVQLCSDKAHQIHEQRVAGEIKQARLAREAAEAKTDEHLHNLKIEQNKAANAEEMCVELTEKITRLDAELAAIRTELKSERNNVSTLTADLATANQKTRSTEEVLEGVRTELRIAATTAEAYKNEAHANDVKVATLEAENQQIPELKKRICDLTTNRKVH